MSRKKITYNIFYKLDIYATINIYYIHKGVIKIAEEKILVVDDEREIAELIRDYLEIEGFSVILADNGKKALDSFAAYSPDLIILDIMMPEINGMEVCREIRSKSNIPILILSARKNDADKILGLGLGADDYITKPFSPGELVARVKAQLRRYKNLSGTRNRQRLKYGDLEIDLQAYDVLLAGEKVELSAREFEVLKYLALNPNIVLSREKIFEEVWGFNEFGDINTVTVHIRRIREKIEKDNSNPDYIQTVWGVGYKFVGGSL